VKQSYREQNQNMTDDKQKQGWKKRISDLLKELGFIDKDFKGKVIININQGETRNVEETKYHN
jgi:hypothetical protein